MPAGPKLMPEDRERPAGGGHEEARQAIHEDSARTRREVAE